MTETNAYLIPIAKYAAKGQDTVSDCRLANALGHHEGDKTLLLKTLIDDGVYQLSLIGQMEIFDNDGNDYFYSHNKTIPHDVLRELEKGWADQYDVIASACFKWEDENGNPIGDSLDSVFLDAQSEIERLKSFLF